MTILNSSELAARRLALFPDNTSGQISPQDIRDYLADQEDSLGPNGAVIDNDNTVSGISITATPTALPMADNRTSENSLYIPQAASNRVIIKEPAFFLATVRLQGKWATNEDLELQVFVNGAANPVTGGSFIQEGAGAVDPSTISIARFGYVITSAMVAADPDLQGGATVQLVASSTTGTFTFEQTNVELGLEYNQLSIRTVG